ESDQFFQILSYGDYWIITTRDGTQYWFGMTFDPGVKPPNNPNWQPYSPKLTYYSFATPQGPVPFTWYLSKIQDTSGNVIIIGYDHFQDVYNGVNRYIGLSGTGGCNSNNQFYDQAVYPVVMAYSYVGQYGTGQAPLAGSTPQVRVYFSQTSLTDPASGQPGRADFVPLVVRTDYCLQSYYYNQALGSVDIRVVMNGVETSTPIRHYQLTYGNGIPLELASIQETGSDGQ